MMIQDSTMKHSKRETNKRQAKHAARVLQGLMYENGLSNHQLALALRVSPSSITRWLSGEHLPHRETIKQLAKYFSVKPAYITGKPIAHSWQLQDNMRYLMHKKRVTISQLAESLGKPYHSVASWLEGQRMPRSQSLKELADYFGVTIDALLYQKLGENAAASKDAKAWLGKPAAFWQAMVIIDSLSSAQQKQACQLLKDAFKEGGAQ